VICFVNSVRSRKHRNYRCQHMRIKIWEHCSQRSSRDGEALGSGRVSPPLWPPVRAGDRAGDTERVENGTKMARTGSYRPVREGGVEARGIERGEAE